jgi:hypothetical protein
MFCLSDGILTSVFVDVFGDGEGLSDHPGALDDSEHELQGASCTIGGICQGKAVGNTPAFVDLELPSVDHLQ